jgi:hypothetical protein
LQKCIFAMPPGRITMWFIRPRNAAGEMENRLAYLRNHPRRDNPLWRTRRRCVTDRLHFIGLLLLLDSECGHVLASRSQEEWSDQSDLEESCSGGQTAWLGRRGLLLCFPPFSLFSCLRWMDRIFMRRASMFLATDSGVVIS